MTKLDKLMEAYLEEGIGGTIKKVIGQKPFKLTSGAFEAKGATTLKGTINRVKASLKKKLRK